MDGARASLWRFSFLALWVVVVDLFQFPGVYVGFAVLQDNGVNFCGDCFGGLHCLFIFPGKEATKIHPPPHFNLAGRNSLWTRSALNTLEVTLQSYANHDLNLFSDCSRMVALEPPNRKWFAIRDLNRRSQPCADLIVSEDVTRIGLVLRNKRR